MLLLALLPLPALADADVDPEALLREYADGNGGTPAVVALVIDRDPASGAYRQAVYTHGELDGRPPDRDTLFEIGSISKVFTSLLLADMVRRGEVRLDTTIGELADVVLPEDVASITLQELSRHTSGLPRLPMSAGFWMRAVFRAEDPYAGTTREDLLRPLRKVDVGTRGAFAYSNFGVALLGQLLADRAGKPYRQLLEERVLRPHGMSGIYFDVASAPRERLVQGWRANGLKASHWHFGAYAPAGSLVASAAGLGAFVEQQMDADRGLWRFTGADGAAGPVRLGWLEDRIGTETLIWHNGGTGGFSSFAGFLPAQGRGVVVLSNSDVPVDFLARRLLGQDSSPPPHHRPAWTAVTAVMMLLAPLGLAGRRLRRRWDSGRPVRSENRWDVIAMLAGYAFIYSVFVPFGNWTFLPIWVAWVSIGIAALLAVSLLPEWKHLEWRGEASRWRFRWAIASAVIYAALTLAFVL